MWLLPKDTLKEACDGTHLHIWLYCLTEAVVHDVILSGIKNIKKTKTARWGKEKEMKAGQSERKREMKYEPEEWKHRQEGKGCEIKEKHGNEKCVVKVRGRWSVNVKEDSIIGRCSLGKKWRMCKGRDWKGEEGRWHTSRDALTASVHSQWSVDGFNKSCAL